MSLPTWCARGAGTVARTLAVATAVVAAAVATAIPQPAAAVQVAFRITGSVDGLYPGATRSLKLTLVNHETFRIAVISISTTVHDASPNCAAKYVTVAAFTGDLVLPAGGARAVHVPVHLSHAAGDACQGATFPFTYTGRAKKA